MESKIKNIIREVPAEQTDLSFYFDGDCYNANSGDYNNTVFIVQRDWGRVSGYNIDEYKRIMDRADEIASGFHDVENGTVYLNGYKPTFKDVMQEQGLDFSPSLCHKLREWAKGANVDKPAHVAAYLTVTTGKTWAVQSVYGYSQGDYAEVVYCVDNYSGEKTAKVFGEVWLGCAKEFGVIDLDENGEEVDSCYGYIVADCEAWKDEDYKRLVCEWSGCKPEETRLEMIDGYHTYTKYEYRTA